MEETVQSTTEKAANSLPPLFLPKNIRKKEYWRCIKLMAPSREEKLWTSTDAIGAYCLKCKQKLIYSVQNPKNISRHMERYHKDILQEGIQKKNTTTSNSVKSFFSKKIKAELPPVSPANQRLGEARLVKWVAESLRPFSIVEDKGFQEFVQFLCNVNGRFDLPSRYKLKKYLSKISFLTTTKMREMIKRDMKYFSTSTDIWSSRKMDSFMALTLQYVTEDFKMVNFTLEVSQLHGRHTGDFIKQELMKYFESWGLDAENLVMMSRDNGSNIVKACRDWGINDFGCIGHCLHLIVGPLFIANNKHNNDEAEAIIVDSLEEEDDDVVDYDVQELIVITENRAPPETEITSKIVTVVKNLRSIAKYIRSSVIAKEKMTHYQNLTGTKTLGLELDVRTRWNSTYKMLVQFIRLKTALKSFLDFLKSPEGKKEFNRKALPKIEEKEWALVTGVCMLLQPFNKVTSILSGEKYPTFIYAMPYLVSIHSFLRHDNLFSVNINNVKDAHVGVKQMFETYGEETYFQEVLGNLKILQKILLRDFGKRFSNLSDDIIWTTSLDPRCRQLKHLSALQRSACKKMLIKNVYDESMLEMEQSPGMLQSPEDNCNDPQTTELNDIELFEMNFLDDILDAPCAENSNEDGNQQSIELLRKSVEVEVENYLNPSLHIPSSVDALSWWYVNHVNFPRIAKVARKWLCVSATSTASERVFSDCGLVVTAKRTRLSGFALRDQVLVRRNLHYVECNEDEIIKALKD